MNVGACSRSYFAGKYRLTLHDKAEWQYSEREKENIEVCYTRTGRGNRIATMFVRCSPNARYTILHSHGNAVDLGQMSSFYMGLGEECVCVWRGGEGPTRRARPTNIASFSNSLS